MKKRWLTFILSALLAATVFPTSALATEEEAAEEQISYDTSASAGGVEPENEKTEDSGDMVISGESAADSDMEMISAAENTGESQNPVEGEDESGEQGEWEEPGEVEENEITPFDISTLALPADHRKTVRWTYGNNVYTEFYVTAYDKSTEKELSFDIDYNVTQTASNVTIDLTELMESVSSISDGTNAYTYSYATVYGIDYADEKNKSDENYWQTLGAADQPVTKLVLTYGNSVSGSRLWGYSIYSGDAQLGHINVLAHNDSAHPYLYLQLWCDKGDALPVVAENVNTKVQYTQLDQAINEAAAGDTIQLLTDLDVAVTKTDQYTIDKDLTLDLDGNTIAVSCGNDSYHLFHVASGVEAAIESGTIDGGGSALGNAIFGNGTSSALTDVLLEDLTIENFNTGSNYGTVYVYNGSLTATDCIFSNNENSAITVRSSAGDANLYDGTALTLDGCTISGNTNSSNNYGGGVGVRQISEVNISDCTFTENQFTSAPSGIYGGGGMILYNVGEITLDKNTITGNESSLYGGGVLILSGAAFGLGDKTTVSGNTITGNTACLNGGGLAYYINSEAHSGEAYCTFDENTIDNNDSYARGGGMSMYSNDPGFTFTILSGTVNGNKAGDSGGGIDFAWERPATLQLYSALITENVAAKGGGVWLCPTSETIMHVTFGGAIYQNEATLSSSYEESCADEIRFEGDASGDGYDGMMVNLASRALGGTLMEWYTDEQGARYRDGWGTLIDVTSEEYTDRTEAFSVHGELSPSGIALAKEEAATIISGNESEQGYGGGIASNAVIEFGEEDTELTVVKKWADGNETASTPSVSSVDVTLLRVSSDGTEAELETVTLSEENDWTWTFKELPSNYTYQVREDNPIPGYVPSYETTTDENERAFVTITNSRTDRLSISKEVSGQSDVSDYTFGVTLSKSGGAYNGDVHVIRQAEGGDTQDVVPFKDGKGTVTIQAGETVTLFIGDGMDWEVEEMTDDADSVLIYVDGEVVERPADSSKAYAAVGTIHDSTQVEFINSYRQYFPIDEEIVTDTDNIFNREAWVKSESVNEYNAIEIEMTTNLPVITTYDLENGSYTMNFHEILDSELVLDENTGDFSVYIAGYPISPVYYVVSFDEDTGDDCNFHVIVDLTALYNDGIVTEDMLDGNTEITIFFFADLEGTGLNGSYKSTIWYDVCDGEEILYTSNVDVVEVYTYEISILKYDAQTLEGDNYEGSALAGATLGVYYDKDCREPVTRYVGEGFDDSKKQAYTATSGKDGCVIFYGLAEGTYYVNEIEAPNGYLLSDEILEVKLGEDLNDSGHTYHGVFANTPGTIGAPGSGTGSDGSGRNGTGAGGSNPNSTGSTRTGDNNMYYLWIALIAAAAALIIVVVAVRTRRTKTRR